jgi:hypothetical protein
MARADTTTPDRADLLYEAATGLAFTAPYPTIVVEPAPRATTSATASYRYAWIGAPSGGSSLSTDAGARPEHTPAWPVAVRAGSR